jgi:Rieske 2Fe-2S family protein
VTQTVESSTAPLPRGELEAVLDPRGSGRMLPRGAYTDPAVLEWERQHFFADSWVNVGRAGKVAEPGERHAVRIGNEGVMLVRAESGELHAFSNVCRHRGHELLPCGESDKRTTIACPYHAWVYDLDGSLRVTPRFEPPEGFDISQYSLFSLPVAEWGGWVFVNPSGTAGSFDDHIGGFKTLVAQWQPERLVVGATHEYRLDANWKLAIENYHECYHCPVIHPELCRVSPPTSGENFEEVGLAIGGHMDLVDGAQTMSLDGSSPLPPLPGLDAKRQREVLYAGLFPNLLVSLHPDFVMTHRIEPLEPGAAWVECQWLFDPEEVAKPGFDPSFAVDFWDLTNRQDWGACESVQRGIASRGYNPGPFSLEEEGVRDWVTFIARGYLEGGVRP